MTTGASPTEDRNEPEREEERASPEPTELLRRAELRADREVRDFVRQMRNKAAQGAAFQAGKETAKVIWQILTDN